MEPWQVAITQGLWVAPSPMAHALLKQLSSMGSLSPAQWQQAGAITGLGEPPPTRTINTGPQPQTGYPIVNSAAWPYQREGIDWLRSNPSCILADEMGLGKTLQILHALPYQAPILLFSPLGARSVWAREIAKWCPRPHEIITEARKMRLPAPGELLIANLDKLWRSKSEGGRDREPLEVAIKNLAPRTILVVDEAHALKAGARKTLRVKRWRMLARAIRNTGGHNIGITGTPVLNYKQELYNLLVSFGLEDRVFKNWGEAQQLLDFENKFSSPHACVKERLRRVMLRRTRLEVFPQMPEKIREYRDVAIPKDLCQEMDLLWEKLKPYRLDTLEDFQAALWAVGGIEVFSLIRSTLASAKIPTILEIADEMEEAGEPLVVCSAYRAPVAALALRPGWAKIDGNVSGNNRGAVEDDFREGRLQGVGLTIKAGGVGISLTRATRMIMADLEWSPELNAQAEDRLRPHLQKRACVYIYLQTKHPLDQHVSWLLRAKAKLIKELY